MATADGLAIIPEEADGVAVGEGVDVMLMSGGLHSAHRAATTPS
jgi:molybdopterin biosynthesis enzyme